MTSSSANFTGRRDYLMKLKCQTRRTSPQKVATASSIWGGIGPQRRFSPGTLLPDQCCGPDYILPLRQVIPTLYLAIHQHPGLLRRHWCHPTTLRITRAVLEKPEVRTPLDHYFHFGS
jgi:hypothetical protein